MFPHILPFWSLEMRNEDWIEDSSLWIQPFRSSGLLRTYKLNSFSAEPHTRHNRLQDSVRSSSPVLPSSLLVTEANTEKAVDSDWWLVSFWVAHSSFKGIWDKESKVIEDCISLLHCAQLQVDKTWANLETSQIEDGRPGQTHALFQPNILHIAHNVLYAFGVYVNDTHVTRYQMVWNLVWKWSIFCCNSFGSCKMLRTCGQLLTTRSNNVARCCLKMLHVFCSVKRVFPRLRYIKLIHTELPLAGCDKLPGENQPVCLLLVVRFLCLKTYL